MHPSHLETGADYEMKESIKLFQNNNDANQVNQQEERPNAPEVLPNIAEEAGLQEDAPYPVAAPPGQSVSREPVVTLGTLKLTRQAYLDHKLKLLQRPDLQLRPNDNKPFVSASSMAHQTMLVP